MDVRVHRGSYRHKVQEGGLCGRMPRHGRRHPKYRIKGGEKTRNVPRMVWSWRVRNPLKSLMQIHPHFPKESFRAAVRASKATALQLARGDKALVKKAKRMCRAVKGARQKRNCIKDVVVGGGREVPEEANKALRDMGRKQKWYTRWGKWTHDKEQVAKHQAWWKKHRKRFGKFQDPQFARPNRKASFSYHGWQFYRYRLRGQVTSPRIAEFCEQKQLLTICDHHAYADNRCVSIMHGKHFSYNP